MTTQEELRRAYLNEQNLREYQQNKRALNKLNNMVSKYNQLRRTSKSLLNSGNNLANAGQKMQNIGNFLQKSNNQYINQLGNKLGNTGTNLQNTGNNLQSKINTKFNVNNTPAPNSSAAGVQQQPTSLFGKMQSGLNRTSGGITDPQAGQQAFNSLPAQQYQQMGNNLTNQGLSKLGMGNTGLTQGTSMGSTPGMFGASGAMNGMGSGAGNSLIGGAINSNIAGGSAGSTGAVGSAIGSNVAGGTAAGTGAGTTAVGGAISSAAPSAASSAGAGLGATAGTTAGTAAGTTAGASTAAGGAAAAGAGASAAIPVIGWGIAAASLLYNLFNSQRKKQQAKAMQASQQATADNVNESEQEGQEAMQNIANQNQQFQANNPFGLQPDSATQEQMQQQKIAELMSMFQSGQPTGGASGVDQQQIADILNANLQQNNGQITGGAAPVQQQPVATTTPQAQQLNGGVTQTVDPNAQPQQPPQFGDQVYQAGRGTSKAAQLFDQIRQGYKDNTENTLGNTYFAPNQQKTFANRVGEVLGTGQRIASNPLVQGGIAGLVNYANGGNFGQSALTGIEWARNKADSDRYEQLINGNNKRSFIGNYTADDYKNKLTADKYAIDNMINQNKADAYINNINNQIKNRDEGTKLNREKFDYDKKDKDRNFKEKQRTNKVKESQGWAKVKQGQERNNILRSKQISNPQSNPDWNNDLAELHSIVVSGDKNKIDYATQSFIKKYGIDPRKKISDKYYDDYDEYEDEEE